MMDQKFFDCIQNGILFFLPIFLIAQLQQLCMYLQQLNDLQPLFIRYFVNFAEAAVFPVPLTPTIKKAVDSSFFTSIMSVGK